MDEFLKRRNTAPHCSHKRFFREKEITNAYHTGSMTIARPAHLLVGIAFAFVSEPIDF